MRNRLAAGAWAATDRILDVGVALVLVSGLVVPIVTARALTGDPVLLNEMLISHTGPDTAEFVELYGTPGYSLAGLSLAVVEGDGAAAGILDLRVDFGPADRLGGNGYFLVGNPVGLLESYGVVPDVAVTPTPPAEVFENGSQTVALVATATLGAPTTRVTGTETVFDALGLQDPGFTESFFWGAPVFGPIEAFLPAGARRATDGLDTDTAGDWVVADDLLGPANTPTPASALDEPPTATCGPTVTTPSGTAASAPVSASDPDGLVGSFGLEVTPDPETVGLGTVTPSSAVGGTATTTVEVAADTPPGSYQVLVTAFTTAATPQQATCAVSMQVDAAPEGPPPDPEPAPSFETLSALLGQLVADGSVHRGKAGQLQGHLDRAARFAQDGEGAAAAAQLRAFTNQVNGFDPKWVDPEAADELNAASAALAASLAP